MALAILAFLADIMTDYSIRVRAFFFTIFMGVHGDSTKHNYFIGRKGGWSIGVSVLGVTAA
jgi:hypothetical protein